MGDGNSILNAVNTITKEIGTSGSLVAVVLASPPPALEPFLKISKEQLSYQMNVNLIGQTILLQNLIKSVFKKKRVGTVVGILTEAIGCEERPPATVWGHMLSQKVL